jgi:hypothetical protein
MPFLESNYEELAISELDALDLIPEPTGIELLAIELGIETETEYELPLAS